MASSLLLQELHQFRPRTPLSTMVTIDQLEVETLPQVMIVTTAMHIHLLDSIVDYIIEVPPPHEQIDRMPPTTIIIYLPCLIHRREYPLEAIALGLFCVAITAAVAAHSILRGGDLAVVAGRAATDRTLLPFQVGNS